MPLRGGGINFFLEDAMFTEYQALPKQKPQGTKGIEINRILSSNIENIFSTVEWETRSVTTGSGKIIENVEFPAFWSENARIQVAEKYFRRADVPQFPDGIYDRHAAEAAGIDWQNLPTGPETSLKRVINRLAGTLTYWGTKYGYFASQKDANGFYNELAYMMLHQYGALNSPQWFNTGMHWAYGISSDPKGQWYYDFEKGKAVPSRDGFEHPQAHACFILGVKDDLFGPNGIFDTARREAQIFYFGSGAGSNYSTLRGKGEPVSGGGVSSGMMSFLDVFDVGGGVIKSGGKTRRAAKMDICSDTHPEVREFAQWKMRQEKMVRILIQAGMSGGFEDEAYRTVRGMNSNNTIAFSHKFFDALRNGDNWKLRWVTDPNHVSAEFPARDLWDEAVYATWFSADPGIHATDTINEWHTCPKDGRIVSSNPCSEYLFIDETACNLASLNLVRFYDLENNTTQPEKFNVKLYRHAVRIWQLALDITVSMAQYPAEDFCTKSLEYRTTGLGFTNLGGLLMLMGYGYASREGQQIAGALTAIMGGESYSMSAYIAKELSPYPAYKRNAEDHLRVVRNHRRAAYGSGSAGASLGEYENITKKPKGLNEYLIPEAYWYLIDEARNAWDIALSEGQVYGYRNAQTTVLAPTGTISFAMDADTFGVEPDYALIKYKALAGGGYAVIVNRLLEPALRQLGYEEAEISAIAAYVQQHGVVEGAPHLSLKHYGVFDTAVPAKLGARFLSPRAHIEMMAATQPFLSGAISKTVNLPEEATQQDISDAYLYGYELGLKAIAVYRANSKAASVMYTNFDEMQKRQSLDLGAHAFDIKTIFSNAVQQWGIFRMHGIEDLSEQPMLQEEMISVRSNWSDSGHSAHDTHAVEMAEAIDMPTYGCKDGVCSI